MIRKHLCVMAIVLFASTPTALLAEGATQPVKISIGSADAGPDLPDRFLGLSFESSMLIPREGRHYFEAGSDALVRTFRTLGIKSLRVGANAVDDARVPVPGEADIDSLFAFARAADVKVIYSFRLNGGNPANSAKLASYIAAHDSDALDCFSIGNEPNYYLGTFEAYFAQWKLHYDAILAAVPTAMFDGPSTAEKNYYALKLVDKVGKDGHLAMASDHYYWLGSGKDGEKNPPATRDRFLSDGVHQRYEKDYAQIGAVLASKGVPYRIDELNNCFHGGAKGSSDTYASALWVLDCTHWWAAHHILGMNYHTSEAITPSGRVFAAKYTSFTHTADGTGIDCRPIAYGYLAFNQGARGHALAVQSDAPRAMNFDVYAYRDHDGSIYLTLINKSHGDHGMAADVSVQLPGDSAARRCERLDLTQKDSDAAATADITVGGAPIDSHGNWAGKWQPVPGLSVRVQPASATIVHLF
jgi:hypothetical protein